MKVLHTNRVILFLLIVVFLATLVSNAVGLGSNIGSNLKEFELSESREKIAGKTNNLVVKKYRMKDRARIEKKFKKQRKLNNNNSSKHYVKEIEEDKDDDIIITDEGMLLISLLTLLRERS